MDPVTDRTRFDETQREYFEDADAEHFSWQTEGPYFRDSEASLVSDVTLAPNERLLEIGCGEGGNLYHLKHLGGRRFGIDFSLPKARFARLHASAHTAASDGAALPFRDGAFDAVLIRDLLHHVPQREAVLAEAFRVLRPGGRLTLVEPNRGSLFILLQATLVPAERGLFRSHAARLRTEVLRTGFSLDDFQCSQPLPLERVVLHPRLGLSSLGALAPVRTALLALDAVARRVLPRSNWAYMRVLAHRPDRPTGENDR